MMNRIFVVLLAGAHLVGTAFSVSSQTLILPFGDSITANGSSPESSYRYWLWQYLQLAGYSVDFIGSQQGVADGTPQNSDFDQNHEGHPGWTTQDALNSINSIAGFNPDIVLLDLGSNDVIAGIDPDTTAANLQEIIDTFRVVNPNVIILLAAPTPWITSDKDEKKQMSRLKATVNKVAKAKNRSFSPVIKVNLFGGFNARKDTKDGTHPNVSGEQKIAKKYFKALRKAL